MEKRIQKVSASELKLKKGKEKIVCITAYDALFAQIFDRYVDLILVGDSLHMSFNNSDETVGISLNSMIYHSRAVCAGAKRAFIVGDMPFGSYHTNEIGIKNAVKYYKSTSIDALKLEGGVSRACLVKNIVNEGIAVMGHIGIMPQFARSEGGYKVKGKEEESKNKLVEDALALEEAGAFAIICEGVKSEVASHITSLLKIPLIGIGAGVGCDGQILVWSDAFGFYNKFKPKFVRRFMNGADMIEKALEEYVSSVKNCSFPDESESY